MSQVVLHLLMNSGIQYIQNNGNYIGLIFIKNELMLRTGGLHFVPRMANVLKTEKELKS